MRVFVKPTVLISKCIEYDHCRYNGEMISSDFVKKLTKYAEMVPICPETEIGLGIPRYPLRVVRTGDGLHLIQRKTEKDLTETMVTFSRKFLGSIESLDGIILKDRSPTCGLRNVGIFNSELSKYPVRKRAGIFSTEVLKRFPYAAIGDENQLNNFRFQDHFLMKLFTLSEFREIRGHESMKNIVQFHAENKYLLTAYNKTEYSKLGKLIANKEKQPFDVVMREYFQHLIRALTRPPKSISHVTILMHALGHFSPILQDRDRELFLTAIENFKKGHTSVSEPRKMIKGWIKKFDEEYLGQQTYFEPYPEEIIHDLGKYT